MNLDDTIVAISSPPGESARGLVRLSGPDALSIAAAVFDAKRKPPIADRTTPARISGDLRIEGSRLPSQAILFIAPNSYTRQNTVELHTLGSPALLQRLLDACLAAGARRAEPGEFTARAFMAGAFDLSQVYGIAGMIAARSDLQHRAAERLLHGSLSRTAHQAREEIAELLSLVEGALDFADEMIEFITPTSLRDRLRAVTAALEATAAAGIRTEHWSILPRIVLTGRPNSGKSSLLNRLSGLDRAICTAIAGTTRDVLSAPVMCGSFECLLIDTAGIADESSISVADTVSRSDDLDAIAQQEAQRVLDSADLLLHVVDLRAAATDLQHTARHPRPASDAQYTVPSILVGNKRDHLSQPRAEEILKAWAQPPSRRFCLVSATTGLGCDELKLMIEDALVNRPVAIHDDVIAMMAEHRDALDRAIESTRAASEIADLADDSLEEGDLIAAELRTAAAALAVLAGQDDVESLLGRVFSRFCVGK